MFEGKVFWREDFEGSEAQGGFHFRSFDLNKFLKKVEGIKEKEVVGIKFEGNNIEIIIEK